MHENYAIKAAPTGTLPRDSSVKSHPVVKLVFNTLYIIHHPTAASTLLEHETKKLPQTQTALILKQTSHQETKTKRLF